MVIVVRFDVLESVATAPINRRWLNDLRYPNIQAVEEVSDPSPIEGVHVFIGPFVAEMLVAEVPHSLVRSDIRTRLVHLANEENDDPYCVEGAIDIIPYSPRRSGGQCRAELQRRPKSAVPFQHRIVLRNRQDDVAVHIPAKTDAEEEEVGHEVFEIVPGDAVVDPRAMMVESRDAFVAGGAVFRPQRASQQAREAKVVQFYLATAVCQGLGFLNDSLVEDVFVLIRSNRSRVHVHSLIEEVETGGNDDPKQNIDV